MKFYQWRRRIKFEYVEISSKAPTLQFLWSNGSDSLRYLLSTKQRRPQKKTSIPIGKPLSNYKVYIADQYGRPQPVGVPGELLIGGEGIARGYLNHETLTKAAFVLDESGERVYRTGDLARWLSDGNIEF